MASVEVMEGRGVVSNFAAVVGTDAGSTAQHLPEIGFFDGRVWQDLTGFGRIWQLCNAAETSKSGGMWPFKLKIQTGTKGLAEPGDDLYALFGLTPNTATGVPVTPDAALRVPAVGSAIRVISEVVATLDVSVKRLEADGAPRSSCPVTRLCPSCATRRMTGAMASR